MDCATLAAAVIYNVKSVRQYFMITNFYGRINAFAIYFIEQNRPICVSKTNIDGNSVEGDKVIVSNIMDLNFI